jgi:RHS repeat-associated protein
MKFYKFSFFLISLSFISLLNAEEGEKSYSFENLEAGISTMVGDCVNVISGDYIESSNDLVLLGPELLIFERFYQSSFCGTTLLGGGWKHNHFASVKTQLIKDQSKFKYVGELTTLYKDTAGRSLLYKGKDISGHEPDLSLAYDPSHHQKGWTNTGLGVVSARTNSKNSSIQFIKRTDYYDAFVTEPNGTKFHFTGKDLSLEEEDFHLRNEIKPSGHIINYGYNGRGHRKITLMGNNIIYNQFTIAKEFEKENSQITISALDGRSVNYKRCNGYIHEVTRSDAPTETYTFSNREPEPGTIQRSQIASRNLPDNRFRTIEYFRYKDKGIRHKDFRMNRVKNILAPVGVDATPIVTYRFDYQANLKKINSYYTVLDGHTIVYNALDCKSIYAYNTERRLTQTQLYKGYAEPYKIYSSENISWGTGQQDGYILSKVTRSHGQPICGKTFRYDDRGNIVHETLYGTITDNPTPLIWTGAYPENNNTNCYSKYFSYSTDGLNLMLRQDEDNGKTIHYSYLPGTDLLTAKIVSDKNGIKVRSFYTHDANGVVTRSITDNGSSLDVNDLSGVTERKITAIAPRVYIPIGLPERIDEMYLDLSTGQEVLIKRVYNGYTIEGNLTEQTHCDNTGTPCYQLKWTYDAHGNVLQETDALGQITERQYDANGNMIFEKGPQAHYTRHYYDYSNRLIRSEVYHEDGTVLATTNKYDYVGNLIATVDPLGHETRYSYDEFNRLTATYYPTTPDKNDQLIPSVTTKEYDVLGHVTAQKNQRGESTFFQNNVYGKPLLIIYPDNSQERFQYNGDGTLRTATAKNGMITVYTNDSLGRVTQTDLYSPQIELISTTSSTYNGLNLVSTTDSEGQVIKYRYDGAGRVIAIEKGDVLTTVSFDSLGRPDKTRAWYGKEPHEYRETVKTYDYLDRVTQERIIDGKDQTVLRSTQYTYDPSGNILEESHETDAGLATTRFQYNAHKQPIMIIDPEGNVTRTTYNYNAFNRFGQRVLEVTVTDPLGNQTITTMTALNQVGSLSKKNAMGDLISKKEMIYSPIGDCEEIIETVITPNAPNRTVKNQMTYNFMHQLSDVVEAAGTPEQKHLHFTYNQFGQKVAIVKPDGIQVLHSYDAKGRLSSMWGSDNSFSYTYTYDKNDHPIAVTDNIHQSINVRTYETQGRLISEKLSTGHEIKYAYDSLARPTQVTLPDGSAVNYSYNATDLKQIDRLSQTGELLYTHRYTNFDQSGKITTTQLPKQAGEVTYRYNKLGSVLSIEAPQWSEALRYNPVGNLVQSQIKDQTPSHYTYDDLYQLKSETGFSNHTYVSDSLYNCVNKDGISRTLNARNQLLQDGDTQYSYDLNGNMIAQNKAGTQVQYTYDALDRLITVTNGSQEVAYTYDAFNRRLTKQTAQSKVSYLYQGQDEVGACDETGKIIELRILGISKGAEIGASIAFELYGTISIPIHDHNGNVATLLDLEGNTVETYRYTAFGEETIFNSNGDPLSLSQNPWRFSSKRKDEETGFIYFGRRYYDPSTARWVSPDPLGFSAGPNLYAYVMNNPLTHIDHYGLEEASTKTEKGFFDRVCDFFSQAKEYVERGIRAVREIARLPGRIISKIGQHFVPHSGLNDFVRNIGRFCSGDWSSIGRSKPASNGVIPGKNLYPGYRLGLANGIYTTEEETYLRALARSVALGGETFYYSAGHTNEGVIPDTFETALMKAGIRTSTVEEMSKQLQEGTQNENEIFVLELWSRSCVAFDLAIWDLSEEQRNRVFVHTYGPAKIIDEDVYGLHGATNVVGKWDIVPMTDPAGLYKARTSNYGNVTFVDSAYPGEHSLGSGTYKRENAKFYSEFYKTRKIPGR